LDEANRQQYKATSTSISNFSFLRSFSIAFVHIVQSSKQTNKQTKKQTKNNNKYSNNNKKLVTKMMLKVDVENNRILYDPLLLNEDGLDYSFKKK
jgi:hypothetical protein